MRSGNSVVKRKNQNGEAWTSMQIFNRFCQKKAKSFNNKCRLASQVNIGCCMEDWCSLKSEIGVLTDEEMARTLIDRYTIPS